MATKAPQLSNADADPPSFSEGPAVLLPISDPEISISNKRRKMARGQLTHGQRAAKIRSSSMTPDQCRATVDTTEDNLTWTPVEHDSDTMDDSVAIEPKMQPHPAPGIRWISESPNLSNAPYITFSMEQHTLYSNNAQKIIMSFKGHLSQSTK